MLAHITVRLLIDNLCQDQLTVIDGSQMDGMPDTKANSAMPCLVAKN